MKSPHPPPCGIDQRVAMNQTILGLIRNQKITDAARFQRRKAVFFTPDTVNLIKLYGTDGSIFLQLNVSFGL